MKNKDLLPWILLSVTTAIFVYIRIRLLSLPLERDEGEYAYAGQLILQGSPPYREVYNMKFPGVYYFYSLFLLLFGNSLVAIRFGVLLMILITAFFILKTGEIIRSRITGIFAAAGFLALSAAPQFHGVMANAEHFVNLFVASGAYFLFKWVKEEKSMQLFLSGISAGAACVMKQHGIYFLIVAEIICLIEISSYPGSLKKIIKSFLSLASGFLVVMLLLLFSVLQTGTFEKFVFLTIDYGRYYVSYFTFKEGFPMFFISFINRINHNHLMWLAVLSGVIFSYKIFQRKEFFFLLVWLLFSITSVFPGFYFRQHYFLLMVPVVAVYFGIFFSWIFSWRESKYQKLSVVTLFTASLLYFLIGERKIFFLTTPSEASVELYGIEVFNEALTVSDFIQKNSSPADRILVFGSEPEIYFYSKRKAASGYLYLAPFLENHPLRDSMFNEYIHESIRNKPTLIVNSRNTWSDQNLENTFFTNMFSTDNRYSLVGFSYSDESRKNHFVWNGNKEGIPADNILWEIYKRN